jgi:ABC-type glutathione transport system ATPase component
MARRHIARGLLASGGGDAVNQPLLEVRGASIDIPLRPDKSYPRGALLRAVEKVSFTIGEGETLGLVGESGSGKSTLGNAIVGLRPLAEGLISFDNRSLSTFDRGRWKTYRREVQMIFQDPSSALNPRMTLSDIVVEPMIVHRILDNSAQRKKRSLELLEKCGLSASMASAHPHSLSGGQKQRAALARALACEPRLIIADEPTSALDVSVQSQMLQLLKDLQRTTGISMLFISHDLGVIRQIAHRVAVMAAGEIVETGNTASVFARPDHEYTQALLASYVLDRKNRPATPDPPETVLAGPTG